MQYVITIQLPDGKNFFCGFDEISPRVMANIWDTNEDDAIKYKNPADVARDRALIGLVGGEKTIVELFPETVNEMRTVDRPKKIRKQVFRKPDTFKRLNDKSK